MARGTSSVRPNPTLRRVLLIRQGTNACARTREGANRPKLKRKINKYRTPLMRAQFRVGEACTHPRDNVPPPVTNLGVLPEIEEIKETLQPKRRRTHAITKKGRSETDANKLYTDAYYLTAVTHFSCRRGQLAHDVIPRGERRRDLCLRLFLLRLKRL